MIDYLFFLERGRSRRKKRDFFGTLRRRLNRSKTRSRSVGPGGELEGEYDPLARSISADRARDPSAHSTGIYIKSPLNYMILLCILKQCMIFYTHTLHSQIHTQNILINTVTV